jgi:adenosylcobinamide-GDP ribazoletransferase
LYFRKRIGGYTGDCLGAVQQVSELAFVLAALAVVGTAQRTG